MPRFLRSGRKADFAEQPFWRQRGWRLSAVFLAVALIAGAVVVTRGQSNGSGEPAAGIGIEFVRIDAAPGLRPEGCRTDDSPQNAPVRAPDDVTWRQLNGAPVPLSRSAGPQMIDGPLLWCFAHTPMGAVMAANVIPRQMSGAGWALVVDQQVANGEGRDIFVAMRSTVPETTQQHTVASLAGFSLLSYTPETATVRLLIKSAQVMVTADYTVVWSGGDWKLRTLPSGDLHTSVMPVANLDGFIVWKV
ncbi:hypothetical protein ACI2K4_00540 [Micromonospora sp. NPDC050397]|uniref:hypothetical protein n=1 Tax=Micromonospora sp. NPDC050397 TaxID=3364279 RepID=UPI00384E87A8